MVLPVSKCSSGNTRIISRSSYASRKTVRDYTTLHTGFPCNKRNCLGTLVPIREPAPPATITAYFFIQRINWEFSSWMPGTATPPHRPNPQRRPYPPQPLPLCASPAAPPAPPHQPNPQNRPPPPSHSIAASKTLLLDQYIPDPHLPLRRMYLQQDRFNDLQPLHRTPEKLFLRTLDIYFQQVDLFQPPLPDHRLRCDRRHPHTLLRLFPNRMIICPSFTGQVHPPVMVIQRRRRQYHQSFFQLAAKASDAIPAWPLSGSGSIQ